MLSIEPKVPGPSQTTPKRPANTTHASHATTHNSTAAMGWDNAAKSTPREPPGNSTPETHNPATSYYFFL